MRKISTPMNAIPFVRLSILFWVGVATVLLCGAAAVAGENTWTSSGPYGGFVQTLAIDPSSPQTVYASVSGVGSLTDGGMFKSTNGGAFWTRVRFNLSVDPVVRALAIDPSSPQTIYAGAKATPPLYAGLYKSTNGGASWTQSNSGLPMNANVQALAVDGSSPQTIYAGWANAAGPGGGVFKSINGGNLWTSASSGLPVNLSVQALAIDPSSPQTIYAGTTAGVYKSTNGGTFWAAINTGLTFGGTQSSVPPGTLSVLSLAFDPSNLQTVYAGTIIIGPSSSPIAGGVYKSSNGGALWTAVNSGLVASPSTPSGGPSGPAPSPVSLFIQSLAVDPSNPQTIYAGTSIGVYKSTKGGDSWTAVNSGLTNTNVRALAIDPINPQTLYVGTNGGDGVYRSANGGASWTTSRSGLLTYTVYPLAIDPLNPMTVYAGTVGGGMYKSTDGGASWTSINSGLLNLEILCFAIDPLNSQILYAAGTSGSLYESINGGISWVGRNSGLPVSYIRALAIDPSNSLTIYAGLSDGVFKSTDGGASWAAANTGLTTKNILALVMDALNFQVLYAGTDGGGVFKSTDRGTSWKEINTGLTNKSVPSLAIHPSRNQTIYAGTRGGMGISIDGGASWSDIISEKSLSVNKILIDPSNPQTIYATTISGVKKSSDGGTSWSYIGSVSSNGLAVNSSRPQTLYSGTDDGVLSITFSTALSLSASSLTFDNTNVGATSQKTFTVSNTGGSSLSVTGVTVVGADASQFWVSTTTATIAAGQSQTVTVTFAPTSAGAKSASLSIAHNTVGSPASVALAGNGVGAQEPAKQDSTRLGVWLDLNPAAGNQYQTSGSAGPSSEITIQVFGRNLTPATSYNVALTFDPAVLTFVADKFKAGDYLPGAIALPPRVSGGSVDFGFALLAELGGSPVSGNGLLGTVVFRTNDRLADGFTTLTVKQLLLGTATAAIQVSNAVVKTSASGIANKSPDFNGNSSIDFDDFFKLAIAFGTNAIGETLKFDLNGDGQVNLPDFFLFAQNFGKKASEAIFVTPVSPGPNPSAKLAAKLDRSAGVKAGDTVTLTVSVTGASGLTGYVAEALFDSIALRDPQTSSKLTGATSPGATSDASIAPAVTGFNRRTESGGAMLGGPPVSGNADIASFTFATKPGFSSTRIGMRRLILLAGSKADTIFSSPSPLVLGVNQSPSINLSASSLTFDNTNVGATSQKTFTVSNPGGSALSITGTTVSGTDASQFKVSPATATIQSGTSQTFTVTFTPASEGSKTASLSMAHNASGFPAVVVALTGRGTTSGQTPPTSSSDGVSPKAGDGTGSLDLDLAPGDQNVRTLYNVKPGQRVDIEVLLSQEVVGARGVGPVLTFNPQKIKWVDGKGAGVFAAAVFIPIIKEHAVTYAGSLFGGSVTAKGAIAVLTFETLAGFSDSTEITLTGVSIPISGGTKELMPQASVILKASPNRAFSSPDFSGNADVGFDDFFMLASAFGTNAIGETLKFDLNGDGQVNLADFFLFAQNFGKKASEAIFVTPVSPGPNSGVKLAAKLDRSAGVKAGDTVTLTVSVTGASGLTGYVAEALFDSVALRDLNASAKLAGAVSLGGISDANIAPAISGFNRRTEAGGAQLPYSPVNGNVDIASFTFTTKPGFTFTRIGVRKLILLAGSKADTIFPSPSPLALGVNQSPSINLSALSLTFDNTNVGATSQKTFTVSNPGGSALSITGTTVSGTDASQFKISPATATIPAGGSQTFTVTFSPTSAGAKAASLSIAHSAATSPSSIALSGTAAGSSTPPTGGSGQGALVKLRDGGSVQGEIKSLVATKDQVKQGEDGKFTATYSLYNGKDVTRIDRDGLHLQAGIFVFGVSTTTSPPNDVEVVDKILNTKTTFGFGAASLSGGGSVIVVSGSREAIVTKDALLGEVRFDGTKTWIVPAMELNTSGGAVTVKISDIEGQASAPSPDFNGDGNVDFDDFFLFATAFGERATGEYARYDLDSDGQVGFEDFFVFAQAFGQKGGGAAPAPVTSHAISGRVLESGAGLSGVTVSLSGNKTFAATTGVDGKYVFPDLPDGAYTVSPSKENYSFTPKSQDITLSGSDRYATDFVAVRVSPSPTQGTITGTYNGMVLTITEVIRKSTWSIVIGSRFYLESGEFAVLRLRARRPSGVIESRFSDFAVYDINGKRYDPPSFYTDFTVSSSNLEITVEFAFRVPKDTRLKTFKIGNTALDIEQFDPVSASSYPGGLTGVWQGTYSSNLVETTSITMNLTQSGSSVTGTYSSPISAMGTVSGTISGGTLTFTLTQTTTGCSGSFKGTATVSGNTMSFTFTGSDCFGTHANGKGSATISR